LEAPHGCRREALLWSTRVSGAVFAVFLTLEVPEILLFIGNFQGDAAGAGLVQLGGYVGIVTAAAAWYASAAGVVNGMAGRPVLPVGSPLWGDAPGPVETPAAQRLGGA
jgi:succinate-acetate transporter protein